MSAIADAGADESGLSSSDRSARLDVIVHHAATANPGSDSERDPVGDVRDSSADETGLVGDETGLVTDETGLVADETGLVADGTALVADETGLVTDETAESDSGEPRAKGSKAHPRARARSRRSDGKRSERGGSDKRERILKAAIRVFARKGFYATRVSEIARAAGVADGTIYLYFKNKDDVLISIFEDRITLLIQVLRTEIEGPGHFAEKLRRVVEVQIGLFHGQRDLAEVITINLRQSSRLLKQYAAPLFTEYLDVLVSLIAQGQREGAVRHDAHPWILARALWGAVDGVALTWTLTGGDTAQLQKAATQIANLFLNGLHNEKSGSGSNDTAFSWQP